MSFPTYKDSLSFGEKLFYIALIVMDGRLEINHLQSMEKIRTDYHEHS
jgi:hypothetical protein